MADEISIVVRAEDQFSNVLGNFGNIITGIKSALDLVGDAFRTFRDFALEGLDAVSSYERLTLALTSLNAAQMLQAGVAKDMASAMDVAGVKAEELAQWMQQLAIQSPFTLEGVAQAFRLAQAYGFSADEAKRLTQAMIDFSAGTGASEFQMQRIALALGQISTMGKLTGQDMLQLTQAGLPVAQILADAFGVTTQKIIEMRSDGLLPAQEVIEAITVWIETNFKGAAANFANSWAGLQSTFSDIKQMGMRELFTGILEAVQPLTVEISGFLQGAGMQLASQLGDIAGAFLQNNEVIQVATEFLTLFNQRVSEGVPLVAALYQSLRDVGLGDVVDRLKEFIATAETEGIGQALGDLFSEAWNYVKTVIDPALDSFLADMFSAMEEKINVWVASGGVDRVSNVLLNALTGTFKNPTFQSAAGDALLSLLSALGEVFKSFWNNPELWTASDAAVTSALKNLGKAIMDALADIFIGIVDFVIHPLSADDKSRLAQEGGDWAKSIWQGFINGLNSVEVNMTNWVRDHIVTPVKEFLGIASPSTVFFNIGRDIILGLVNGIGSMLSIGLNIIRSIIDLLLAPIRPILDLLGIDLGSNVSSTTSGYSLGGGLASGGTGTLTGAGTVNNYFYGPVYFGDMGQLGYDCPSPHPLLQASQGSLLHTVNVG